LEDEDARARTIREMLARAGGFFVMWERTVSDARAHLETRGDVDVVLLDLSLPDARGLGALAAVRQRARTVPIVVLATDDDRHVAEDAIAASAQDYLIKQELDPRSLARAIRYAVEIRRAEQRVRAAREEIDRAQRLNSEYCATLSHEIRTPMHTVLGMAELLSETALTPQQKKYVTTLQRAGDHLLALVDDVLDAARIDAGQVSIESTRFDLNQLVEEVLDLMRNAAHKKGLELRYAREPGIPPVAVGDPRRIRQVLLNLLGNAIKFTERGSVEFRIARDQTSLGATALLFSVKDTGIGIPIEKLEAVFGSFVQGDASIPRQFGGAGLGLHIAKRLVELMGGKIWVDSRLGEGSTFHVALDLGIGAAVARPRKLSGEQPVAVMLPPLRVLLVDDSEDSRELIRAFLADTPVMLESASDGPSALRSLREGGYDLVLMDLHLPGMDGYATTREIRQLEALRGEAPVPIVALSADAFEQTVARCLAAGCTMHLAKPVRKRTLLEALVRCAPAPQRAESDLVASVQNEVRALLPKFIVNRRNDVMAIRAALLRGDFALVRTLGHNMHGTGQSYGLPRVGDIGAELEVLALRSDAAGIERCVEALEQTLARIEEATLPGGPSSSQRGNRTRSGTLGRVEPIEGARERRKR
jgi:signal transduction histidine kinase/HPt (histidine-containing phosphotransfer) domain-containing protein